MSLRWRSYLWKEPHPALPDEIERLEATWGVRLPGEYKRLVSLYQGMTPVPNSFIQRLPLVIQPPYRSNGSEGLHPE